MNKTCKNYPWQVLQLTFSPQTVKNLFYPLKNVVKTLFWPKIFFFSSFFCILAESGRGRRSIAEKADGSNGAIVPFVTSDDSRRDHETCWLLDVRSLTNSPDSVISSPKTKGSVTLTAKFADIVDLKDGLLSNRVCTLYNVQWSSLEQSLISHVIQYTLCKDAPGHQAGWTWRFGDSDFMRWYFTVQVLLIRSPS